MCCYVSIRYAKTGMDKRLEWNEFTRDYFLKRESLANVLMLVDASIPPTAIDLSCADWLAESQAKPRLPCFWWVRGRKERE